MFKMLKWVSGVRIFVLSISSKERLNTTLSAVFLLCRFSLFQKDPFFRLFMEVIVQSK